MQHSQCYEPFKSIGHIYQGDVPVVITLGLKPSEHRIYASTGNTFHCYDVCK